MGHLLQEPSRAAALAVALAASAAAPAAAQEHAAPAPASEAARAQPASDEIPGDLAQEVGIVPQPNAALPLDARFMDAAGESVRLGDYFDGERPVLLVLAYYRCSSICTVVLNEVVHALQGIEWAPGEEFDVVTISINPHETPNLARLKKEAYVEELGRPEAAAGWHFLTGTDPAIRSVADPIGFNYRFDTTTSEYAHGAGIFICTPEGRVSRTITGALFDPGTVRLSLVEASEGKIGSPLDQILLYCYHFDPATGRYTAAIMNIVRLLGVLTVLLVGLMIGGFLRRERRARRAAEAASAAEVSPAPTGRSAS